MLYFITSRNVLKFFRNNKAIHKMSLQKETNSFGKTNSVFGCPKVNLTANSIHSNSNNKFKVLPTPVKSESDKKEYKVIKLENGLIACLIADKTPINTEPIYNETSDEDESGSEDYSSTEESDESMNEDSGPGAEEQKMAAAGLCIGVGSFSDPKDVPGMAHFLEHMVFMGSEKFPAENDFDSFIKKRGGSDNASTDTETTCFYFECLEKHLFQALDKFAQFFISPLMKKGAMTREREAIESEFQIALPSDSSRKEQLLCSFAHSDSPVNSFTWGNLITLRDNISDDELYEGVHEFRKRHYSAHRMTLAIQARLPMEALENYVLDCFSNVPNNGLPPDDFTQFADIIFNTPEFTRLYYVKPIKDLCQVDLTWSFPCLRDKYKSKPHQYISHLLGDEGKGSVLSYLRKKVWGLTTSIGHGDSGSEDNSMYALFTVTIVLTDDGLAHLYEVIEVIFSYINMLKQINPQERIFQEMKMISDTAFRFSTEESAVELVEDMCESMQVYPPEDYITGSEIYHEYDPEAIKTLTNLLRPETMNIMVVTKTLPNDVKYDKVEQWFGTEYTDKGIPEEWIKRWQSVEPFPELDIPPPNSFLTTDFSILPDVDNHPDYPQKVLSSPLHEMWYRKDQKFKLPLAYYNFYLISPMSIESASSIPDMTMRKLKVLEHKFMRLISNSLRYTPLRELYDTCNDITPITEYVKNISTHTSLTPVLLDMMINLLVVAVTEEVYPATIADLYNIFQIHEKGLMIKVSGYNEKLPLLIEVISKYLVTLSDHLTEEMFAAVKNKVMKSYYNKLLKPSSLAKDVRLHLLVHNYWTPVDKYSALLNITLNQVKQFSQEFIKSLYVKSLVQGNVSLEVASKTVDSFVNNLRCAQLPDNSYPKFRVAQVPIGEKCCRIQGFSETDSNSIITNYYQSGPFSIKTSVIIEIIMLIIEEPLFDILRTKEQLGYHVYCSIRDTFGILGYTVTVNAQATKHSTSYVDNRIEEFLKYTHDLLAGITEEELNETKEDLIKTKRCTDVHLKEEVDRNWSEIISDDYLFDRLKQEIDMIKDIKIEEIREWWSGHNISGNQDNFRKLSIQVVGHNKKENIENNTNPNDSSDPIPLDKITINLIGMEETCKAESKPSDYFVNNVEKFRENLYLYPATLKK